MEKKERRRSPPLSENIGLTVFLSLLLLVMRDQSQKKMLQHSKKAAEQLAILDLDVLNYSDNDALIRQMTFIGAYAINFEYNQL